MKDTKGWIALHRGLQQHWLWADKPFSKGQAWIDLLMLASHCDNKFLLGNELVEIESGSFITSELKLMERWGWGKTKTRAFLDLLQKDGMITKKTDRKKTTITIENYSSYQGIRTTNKPRADRKQTTSRPRADTINNEEQCINNENNNIRYHESDTLNEALKEFVAYRKKIKKPMTDRALELLISKLNKLSTDIGVQVEILNQSIMNGWQGVFPLKEDYKPAKKVGANGIAIDESMTDLDELF